MGACLVFSCKIYTDLRANLYTQLIGGGGPDPAAASAFYLGGDGQQSAGQQQQQQLLGMPLLQQQQSNGGQPQQQQPSRQQTKGSLSIEERVCVMVPDGSMPGALGQGGRGLSTRYTTPQALYFKARHDFYKQLWLEVNKFVEKPDGIQKTSMSTPQEIRSLAPNN
ncbi:hypothetical protein FOZ63_007919, partial [Perkinsus olseni]